MARYRVKPGYCLHLPHQNFVQAGDEADLNGELEQKVLETQGWKIESVQPESDTGKAQEAGPEGKEAAEPPQDRAIKESKTK